MDAVFYWEMTYGEIIAAIEGFQQRFKIEAQLHAGMVYKLGSLIGVSVNDPKKYPKNIQKAFPNLFTDTNDEEPKQQDWQVMKERISSYNEYLKQKRGETN